MPVRGSVTAQCAPIALGKSRTLSRPRTLRARFTSSAAWLALTSMAHSLVPAVGIHVAGPLRRATVATLQQVLLTVPGRLVHSARRWSLRLPQARPWAEHIGRTSPLSTPSPPAGEQPTAPDRHDQDLGVSRQTGNSTLPLTTRRPPKMNDMQESLKQSIRQWIRAD